MDSAADIDCARRISGTAARLIEATLSHFCNLKFFHAIKVKKDNKFEYS
jgi:hypothetical protein